MRIEDEDPISASLILDAFLRHKGISSQAVANELSRMGGDPKGREITKSRVHTYRSGKVPMPGWFVDKLDQYFAGWRKVGAGVSIREMGISDDPVFGVRTHPSPLTAAIEDPLFTQQNQLLSAGDHWTGRKVNAPSLFTEVTPIQPIVSAQFAPAMFPGDAVGLNYGGSVSGVGHIYLVSANGKLDYAALMPRDGVPKWICYDETEYDFDKAKVQAAVVMLFRQFKRSPGQGVFNELGLEANNQITWPRPQR